MHNDVNPSMVSRSRAIKYDLLLSTSVALALVGAQCARAQSLAAPVPPQQSPIDDNGVNVANGQVSVTTPEVGIGPNAGSHLSFNEFYTGVGWSNNFYMNVQTQHNIGGPITGAIVTIGGSSDAFTWNGSSYSEKSGNGNTLANVQGGFVYTMRDGTVINFSNQGIPQSNPSVTFLSYSGSTFQGPSNFLGGLVTAIPTSMVMPSGETITFTYKTQATSSPTLGNNQALYVRLQSVNSSSGLQIKFSYSQNTIPSNTATAAPPAAWAQIIQAQAINNAIDYCDPSADSCVGLTQAWPSITMASSASGANTIFTVTDAVGATTTFTLDSKVRPIAIRRPAAPSNNVSVTYDSNGFVSSLVREGIAYTYSFSQSNAITTGNLTGPNGMIRITTADANTGVVLTVIDALTSQTTYQEDSNGRVTSVTMPSGNSTQYTYDARGNVTTMVLKPIPGSSLANITLSAGYDTNCTNAIKCNYPNWTKDALGNETDYTYDPTSGLLTSVTLPSATPGGVRPQTRYSYASLQAYFKNAAGSIVASGQNTWLAVGTSVCRTGTGASLNGVAGTGPFTLSGSAACAGSADEITTSVGYGTQSTGIANNLFPLTATTGSGDGALSVSTSRSYSMLGDVTSVTGPLGGGQTTYYMFDADRRTVGVINPAASGSGARSATKYTYNADSILINTQVGTVADQTTTSWNNFAEAYHTAITLDGYDNPIRQITANSLGTAFAISDVIYDSMGRPSCSIQYMNLSTVPAQAQVCVPSQTSGPYGPDRVSQISYDGDNRVVRQSVGIGTAAAAVSVTNTYTTNGKLATITDGLSNLTAYTYDGFDRPLQTFYPSATQGANGTDLTDYEALTYDANGRVVQQRLRDGSTISFTYDNLGRPTTRTPGGTLTYPYDYPVNFSYDLVGHILQIARPGDGSTISYAYDALGRRVSESQSFGSVGSAFDAAGNRTQVTWPDGFYVNYNYNLLGEVTSISENGATSGVGLLASYAYDTLGRRTGVTFGNGTSRAYAYDGIGRLAGVQLSYPTSSNNQTIGGVNGVGSPIAYTPSSQIASITKSNSAYNWNGAYTVNRAYTANGLDQYTTAGGTSFAYDGRGNLITSGTSSYSYSKLNEMTSGPGATIYYDPLSRIAEYDTTASTRFFYDGGEIAAEVANPSGTILRRYVMGPGTDEPIVWYEGSDTSSRRFLQADERGSIVGVSDASGNLININTYDEFGIPGAGNVGRFEYTGQTWFPEVGLYNYKARFYSPTTGRFMQTDPIGYGDGLNMYAYGHGDPINNTDPSGKGALEDVVVNAATSGDPVAGAIVAVADAVGSLFGLFGSGAAAPPPPVIKPTPAPPSASTNTVEDVIVHAHRATPLSANAKAAVISAEAVKASLANQAAANGFQQGGPQANQRYVDCTIGVNISKKLDNISKGLGALALGTAGTGVAVELGSAGVGTPVAGTMELAAGVFEIGSLGSGAASAVLRSAATGNLASLTSWGMPQLLFNASGLSGISKAGKLAQSALGVGWDNTGGNIMPESRCGR